MVKDIIICICLIVFLFIACIWLNQLKKEEIKTNKAKRSMYESWYDLGVLLADIEKEKLNKGDK